MSRTASVLILALVALTAIGCSAGGSGGLAAGVDQRQYMFIPYSQTTGAFTTPNMQSIVAQGSTIVGAGGDASGIHFGTGGASGYTFTQKTVADGLNSNIVNALAVDPDNKLWIGTDVGLNSMANGATTITPVAAGVLAGKVTALGVVGTAGAPNSNKIVVGFEPTAAGNPIAALSTNNGQSFSTIVSAAGSIVGSRTTNIYAASDLIVVCTTGQQGGAFYYAGTSWVSLGVPVASGVNCFTRINGLYYVATDDGIYVKSSTGIGWDPVTGLSGFKAYWIAQDDSTRVFIGTDQGVMIGFGFSQFRTYGTGNNLPTSKVVNGYCGHDTVWLACMPIGTNLIGGLAYGVYNP